MAEAGTGDPPLLGYARQNSILQALQRDELMAMDRDVSLVRCRPGQVLLDATLQDDRVFFPTTAVLSPIVFLPDGHSIATRLVGPAGVAGLYAPAGRAMGLNLITVYAGEVLGLRRDAFLRHVGRSEVLSRAVGEEMSRAVTAFALLVACAHFHSLEQRGARLLLNLLDHGGNGPIRMSQQLIADVLGVRRGSVTSMMNALRSRDVVESRRSEVVVVDRPALEQLACDCYGLLREARAG